MYQLWVEVGFRSPSSKESRFQHFHFADQNHFGFLVVLQATVRDEIKTCPLVETAELLGQTLSRRKTMLLHFGHIAVVAEVW